MSFLLDTHTLLWSLTEKRKLSAKAKETLENPGNTILVSAISFWEISLKFSIGKLKLEGVLPQELPQLAQETGFKLIPVTSSEAATYHLLTTTSHRDPFDKMLIWQAIRLNLIFISKDKNMTRYAKEGLKILW